MATFSASPRLSIHPIRTGKDSPAGVIRGNFGEFYLQSKQVWYVCQGGYTWVPLCSSQAKPVMLYYSKSAEKVEIIPISVNGHAGVYSGNLGDEVYDEPNRVVYKCAGGSCWLPLQSPTGTVPLDPTTVKPLAQLFAVLGGRFTNFPGRRGHGDPDSILAGKYKERFFNEADDCWHICMSEPYGTAWIALGGSK